MAKQTGVPLLLRWLPLMAACVLALAGYYGPWVPHKAAGLIVLGIDLAEYVKFLPGLASSPASRFRELFYLPLLSVSLSAALLASRRGFRGWFRILVGLGSIPIALAMLPPAWGKDLLALPEFRTQVEAIALCLLFLMATPLTSKLPDRFVLAVIALLAIASGLLPAWGFLQVRSAISELYLHPLPLGWGFWACPVGFFLAAFLAVANVLASFGPVRNR